LDEARRLPLPAAALCTLILLAAGCASHSPLPTTRPILLADTPFHSDDGTLCGPSALASVLQQSGAAVTVAELREQIYLPGREGTLQVEMLGGIRRHARVAVALDGTDRALVDALDAGYPVLVLQKLTALWLTSWHYAVIIGYEPDRDEFVLHSGTYPELRLSRRSLLASWRRADYWAYAVASPGEIPPFASADHYLEGIIGLEQAGQLDAARTAYADARVRWPDDPMFGFGYGNVLAREGDLTGAIDAYRETLARNPDHVPALNNLAWALGELNCQPAAMELLAPALQRDDLDADERALLEETLGEVRARPAGAPCQLPP
jgi:tetratricopeptide (TPR) repeat protein